MNSTDLSSFPAGVSLASKLVGQTSSAACAPVNTTGTFYREESLLDFSRWLAEVQNVPVQGDEQSLQLKFPEPSTSSRRSRKNGGVIVRTLSADALLASKSVGDLPEALTLLIASFRDGFHNPGSPAHLRPAGTVDAVKSVTERLFPAYHVEEGSVHLQGCQLESRPFVRISFLVASDERARVRHVYVTPDGSSVSREHAARLNLANTEPLERPPARIANNRLDTLVSAGRRMAAQLQNERDPAASAGEPLAVAVVWARYTVGQLQFSIGQSSAKLSFEGWVRDLVPPKFPCPATGTETFNLTALDDGRVVAAEQAAVCAISGTRALKADLVSCCATGKQVLPELTTICPILGQAALHEQFASCTTCQEKVSLAALSSGVCQACQQLRSIKKDDSRLAKLIQCYPELASRRWWQLAETANVTIVVGSHLFSQAMLVCDRQTLEVKYLATRRRGASRWRAVDATAREGFLGV